MKWMQPSNQTAFVSLISSIEFQEMPNSIWNQLKFNSEIKTEAEMRLISPVYVTLIAEAIAANSVELLDWLIHFFWLTEIKINSLIQSSTTTNWIWAAIGWIKDWWNQSITQLRINRSFKFSLLLKFTHSSLRFGLVHSTCLLIHAQV